MIKINSQKCKGCGLCINVCPKKVLSFSKGFNKAGYHPAEPEKADICISCGFCYQICPDTCIEVYK
ncbi:MAG: 4Fe-4S binding protein [Elusimicrobiota bacterium]|nr:4Fe-4S binding protein [Elusimicrobiota bacterium]